MELNVLERIILLDILPQQGDFTTLKILRKLRESLSFNEEEYKHFNFRNEDNKWFWDNGDDTKDVHMGEKAEDIIVTTLKKLNDDKQLTQDQITLYEKFVENNKSQED